jgi:hypothetical protein
MEEKCGGGQGLNWALEPRRERLIIIRGEIQLKLYKVVAWPTFRYGTETWVTVKRDESIIEAAEMRFFRAVKRCSCLERLRTEVIRNELSIIGNHEIGNKYKQTGLNIFSEREKQAPTQAFKYHPRGKKDPGNPRSLWKLQDAGTGPEGPNPYTQK